MKVKHRPLQIGGSGIAFRTVYCTACLWTEHDPDEQNSLTYTPDPTDGIDEEES